MTRRLINLLTVLSLLLCVTIVTLWAATNRTLEQVSFHVPRFGRYTLYSQYGEVRVFGLPRARRGTVRVSPFVRRIRNEDIDWDACYLEGSSGSRLFMVEPQPHPGTASDHVYQLAMVRAAARDDLRHALVEALEEPDQFIAAHALLLRCGLGSVGSYTRPDEIGQTLRTHYGGLPIELDLSRSEKIPWNSSGYRLRHRGPAVRIDTASHMPVRDSWHFALAVPLADIPYWPFAVATAVLPAVLAASKLKRWRDARLGLCLHCGYDLRATPGRCPECGAEAMSPVPKLVRGPT